VIARLRERLAGRRLRWESLCRQCGACCYRKEWHGAALVILWDAPCRFLDTESMRCTARFFMPSVRSAVTMIPLWSVTPDDRTFPVMAPVDSAAETSDASGLLQPIAIMNTAELRMRKGITIQLDLGFMSLLLPICDVLCLLMGHS